MSVSAFQVDSAVTGTLNDTITSLMPNTTMEYYIFCKPYCITTGVDKLQYLLILPGSS